MSLFSLVFVYGTLKAGQPNHNWLTKSENGVANFKGTGTTVQKYPLIIATKYNIPFLLDAPGRGNNVQGEVYEIDSKMLGNLDILEEHPDFYVRRIEEILLQNQTDSTTSDVVKCWAYFLKSHKPHLLQQEMFTSYDANGSHGLKYCERYCRVKVYDYKPDVLLTEES